MGDEGAEGDAAAAVTEGFDAFRTRVTAVSCFEAAELLTDLGDALALSGALKAHHWGHSPSRAQRAWSGIVARRPSRRRG